MQRLNFVLIVPRIEGRGDRRKEATDGLRDNRDREGDFLGSGTTIAAAELTDRIGSRP